MSAKLFKLYFKLIFSSLIFWLYLLFISGFFCLFTVCIGVTGGDYSFLLLETFVYLEVAVAIFSFCLAVYFIRQRDTLEKVCLIPETKCRAIKVVSLIIASSIICLLPLIYCSVIAVSQQVGFSYCFMTIVFYCARWLEIIILMETMGSLLGYIVKSPFIYLLVLPIVIIFSFLNQYFFQALSSIAEFPEWTKTLISIQNMYVDGMAVDYAVPRLNLLFLSKLIAILAFSTLLLYLLYFAVSKKRRASQSVCMLEGFFSERTENGTTYYSAKYGAIGDDLEKEYERSMTFDHWNYKTMTRTDEPYPSPNKVFQIYYFYDTRGYSMLFGNYMMVHHFTKY